MKVNITIGAKTAFDTDIVNIQEKSGSITVHWKARPGGAHVYTDIQKQTLVDWYEQYAGGVVPPGPTPTGLLYKVGLISDIHMDTDPSSTGHTESEYAEDIANALVYFKNNNVDFVASCGDFCQYKDADYPAFHDAFANYESSMQLYTCMGNHDYQRIYQVRDAGHPIPSGYSSAEEIWQRNVASFMGSTTNIHFFQTGKAWNASDTSGGSAKDKLNYWLEKEGDILVFMSIDYGTSAEYSDVIRGINLLDYSNTYVQQMTTYVGDTKYSRTKETKYDYQFYNPEVLMWLKGILEGNNNKRVLVFCHHFLPHKAGDDCAYSRLRIWPAPINANSLSGSNTPCGLTFWFLNKLNNEFRNAIWFSGHSHREWMEGLSVCNHDYDVIQPSGNEVTPPVDTAWTNYKDTQYDYKLYSRIEGATAGSGAWVALPSLAKPNDGTTSHYHASQGGILEVYEDKVVLKEMAFKKETSSSYDNEVIREVILVSGDDPTPPPTPTTEGIIFRLHNDTGTKICFSGRFLMLYDTKQNLETLELYTSQISKYYPVAVQNVHQTPSMPTHINPPDRIDDWPHWEINHYELERDESMDVEVLNPTDYIGSQAIEFKWEKVTDEECHFINYDSTIDIPGYDWPDGISAIKLGTHMRDVESGEEKNGYLLHVAPLPKGTKIERGKTYDLSIDRIHPKGSFDPNETDPNKKYRAVWKS